MPFIKHPLTEYRKLYRMSQQQLASEADLSTSTVYRLESIGLEGARVSSIIRLAKVMGLEPGDLLTQLIKVCDGLTPAPKGRRCSETPFNDAWAGLLRFDVDGDVYGLKALGSDQHKEMLKAWLAAPSVSGDASDWIAARALKEQEAAQRAAYEASVANTK